MKHFQNNIFVKLYKHNIIHWKLFIIYYFELVKYDHANK